jgi:hypothetical protein
METEGCLCGRISEAVVRFGIELIELSKEVEPLLFRHGSTLFS